GFLQHGRDHHEDDQEHEHNVAHRNYIGDRDLGTSNWLVGHSYPSSGLLLRCAAAQNEVVDQLHRGVVHLDVESFHFVGEVVVGPHGRDGDEQTERGGDERFGDTAGDSRQAGGLLRLDALEGVQDADDRAEESDERRRRTDGGQRRKPALHFRVHDGDGALETAFGGFDDFGLGDLLRGRLELRKTGGDNLGDVALLVALGDGNGFVEFAILEGARHLLHEHTRLLARVVVHEEAVNHDTEGIHRKAEKNNDHDLGEHAHRTPHGTKVP